MKNNYLTKLLDGYIRTFHLERMVYQYMTLEMNDEISNLPKKENHQPLLHPNHA